MSSLSRYEVLAPIGENHYARYFRGYDTVGERDVCIIEFLEKFRKNPERWSQIWQQILSAGRIKHDYMVSVYDYDRERGWVITELMAGSLRELPPEVLRDTELVRTVLYRTLQTLDYLHANKHPHGDVRPANLLYDVEGQTKLSYSPGIALGGQIPRRERDHAFLAPEMFDPSFGDVGVGVDLYGCGMTALNMLLGDEFSKKLLGVAVSDDVAWQRFHRDLNSHPSVRELVPNLPPDMEAVIQKLISKKVDQRFTSIAEAKALLLRPQVEVAIPVSEIKPTVEKKRPAASAPPLTMEPFVAPPKPKTPGKPAGKPRPVRDWLNKKLKNPLVMGLVSAVIVAMMVFAMALISAIKERDKQFVKIPLKSEPKGATVYVGDKKQTAVTDTELKLSPGSYDLKLELAGYQPYSQKIDIPKGKPVPELPLITLKPVPPPPPKVVPPSWKLPEGLEALGMDVDAETKLPKRAVASKVQASLKKEDAPLSFVLIPAGKFTLGATDPLETGEIKSSSVEIKAPYYIAENEVSRGQFRLFEEKGGTGQASPALKDQERNAPVVGVPYAQGTGFCAWLGKEFDLPTESEWERAARGTDGRLYPWGKESPSAEYVIMRATSGKGKIPALSPVQDGLKGNTPEGIHHLLGNAAEWCKDLYTPGFNETAETTGAGKLHVIRGGSYRSPASGPVRITWRANAPDKGADDVGLRVVCHPLHVTPEGK
ncbi:MAG: SUMF1/EgtB/PvdO family nonheme iron enzyme [Planctomycetales bacterium]